MKTQPLLRHLVLLALLVASPTLAASDPSPDSPKPSASDSAQPRAAPARLWLAMDRILPGATEDRLKSRLNAETRAVLNLYLAGHVRDWFFRQDRPGVVLLLEADSAEQARQLLATLPLTQAGLLAYDLIPLGPYVPLATLLTTDSPTHSPKKKPK